MYSRWNFIKTYKSRVNMEAFTKFLTIRTRWHSLRLEKDYVQISNNTLPKRKGINGIH